MHIIYSMRGHTICIGLMISVIVFTTVINILIKTNKRTRNIELATQRRTIEPRYEGVDHQSPREISRTSESYGNYDEVDYEISRVAVHVIATNKNIAYGESSGHTGVYAQI